MSKVHDLCMPSFGADMATGTLLEWRVKQGDSIKRGDVIAVIETHKGAMDLDIFEDAVVEKLLLKEGQKVQVGTPIASLRSQSNAAHEQKQVENVAQKDTLSALIIEHHRERNAKQQLASKDLATAHHFIAASPAARQLAQKNNLSLAQLAADNSNAAITLTMVEAALAKRAREPAEVQPQRLLDENTAQPQKGFDKMAMRQAISDTVTRSKQQIPHYYLSQRLDITALESYLQRYNASIATELRMLLAAPLLTAIARTLSRNKQLNGTFNEGMFLANNSVHLANAVNLRGGGLVMPVIRDAQTLAAPAMMQQLKEQVARARDGSLRVSEMSGGSCTVTSIGERGAEQMFAVIYPPQVAIIALGSAHLEPLVIDTQVQVRSVINASLAADHRVSDGQIGARFLYQLNQQLQRPEDLWGNAEQ